ncbi:MAG: hypothetical protein ABJA83_15275 [Burkholderiaceae bacterium]
MSEQHSIGLDRDMDMPSLLAEMQQCKTVKACIALALTDAYGESEEATAWLTCIEEMFGRFDRVKLMGEEVTLHGFDLANESAVVAICGREKRRARVALESVEFPDLTPIETRWLKAWTQFSRGFV